VIDVLVIFIAAYVMSWMAVVVAVLIALVTGMFRK
jgi:hypothetical protein